MRFVVVMNVVLRVAWIAAAVHLLMNGHPIAGGWCIVGGILSGGWSYSSGNEKESKDEDS